MNQVYVALIISAIYLAPDIRPRSRLLAGLSWLAIATGLVAWRVFEAVK